MALPDLFVYQEITVAESVEIQVADLNVSVYDSVSITESVEMWFLYHDISVAESVAVADDPDVMWDHFIYMDPRRGRRPKAPVWELDALANMQLGLDQRAPVAEVTGRAGSVFDETAPTADLTGSMSQQFSEYLSLVANAPIAVVESRAGLRVSGTAPVPALIAASYANNCSMNGTAPTASVTITVSFDFYIVLDSYSPFPTIVASCIEENTTSLNENAPLWRGYGVVYEILSGLLDKRAPVWSMDAVITDNAIIGDMTAPAWILDSHTAQPNPTVPVMAEGTRFDDMILQHKRWPDAV